MFYASEARTLCESSIKNQEMKKKSRKNTKKKWNFLDTLVLKVVERDIKKCCKEGCRQFFFRDFNGNFPINDKVAEKLRENGYDVFVGSVNGKVVELKIEW